MLHVLQPDSPHAGHEQVKASEVMGRLCAELEREMNSLDAVMKSGMELEARIDRGLAVAPHAIDDAQGWLHRAFRGANEKLEAAVKAALKPQTDQANQLAAAAQSLDDLIEEASQVLGCDDAPAAQAFLDRLDQRMQGLRIPEQVVPPAAEHDLYPPAEVMEASVVGLRAAVDAGQVVIGAPEVHFGNTWQVRIYPNGPDGVGVFVELIAGRPGTFWYQIEILHTRTASRNAVHRYVSEFVVTDSWGWRGAAQVDEILSPAFNHGDVMKCRVLLRPQSYRFFYEGARERCASLRAELANSAKRAPGEVA